MTNTSSNSVSVIDPASNTVVETIPVGEQPAGLAVTPDGAFAYVVHVGSNDVWVIETSTHSVVGVPIPVGSFPRTVTASPDGASVWVANVASNDISVIETITNTVTRTITPISNYPFGIAFTADGTSAYVSRQWGIPVVVDVATGAITGTTPGTQPGFLLTATPDGAFGYLTTRAPSGVDVIDFATNTVVATLDMTCCGAHSTAFTPDGEYAYVSNWGTDEVTVVHVPTMAIVGGRIPLGGSPSGLAVTPDGSRVYVATGSVGEVAVIETSTNTVLATIPVGMDPLAVAAFAPQFADEEPPVVSEVQAAPSPVAVGGPVVATAWVDDAATGGSVIASAEYSLDGGPWLPLDAVDGAFDELREPVTATFGAPTFADVHEVCARGIDEAGNVADPACAMLVSYDPSGGFVTGGGWIYSPAGAYTPDRNLTGRADFGFVSRYKKGAMVPTGSTEFQFKAGDLNFHSTGYDWLIVTGNDFARFKGSGTINGEPAPNGTDFRFEFWAGDGAPDTIRINVWWENEAGLETEVYNNGVKQPIGGGSIVIHTR